MLEALGVNAKEIICAVINFLILIGVLGKFLYKPMLNMLDQRRETIRKAMEQAEQTQAEVTQVHETLKKELADARAQASSIVAEATKNGEEVKNQIIADAQVQAQEILKTAKAEIEEEKARALVELQREVAVMAAMCASKILSGEIDGEMQEELVSKYIGEVGHLQ